MRAGLPKSQINIGLGTYSSGGEWCQVSTACPNLDPAERFCRGPGQNSTHPCANREPSWKRGGPHEGVDGGCPVPLGGKEGAMAVASMIVIEG